MEYIPTIREFIVENFLFGDGGQVSNETNFFEKGIIDSTGILELVSYIEETYNLTIEDEDLVPENFSSLNTLAAFLQKKQLVNSAN